MILALDLGSTSFKAAVVDDQLRLRGIGANPIQHRFAAGGKVELEVPEATVAVRKVVRAAIAASGIRPSTLRAIAVTSQAQTFTIVDRNGRTRMPFTSWQDTRAASTCEKLKCKRAMRDFGEHCSFGAPVPPLQLCQLRHLRETLRGFIGTDNLVMSLPSYFVYLWSGTAVTDENLAAMSGLYSLFLRKWWPAALRVCGLQNRQLPAVHPVGTVVGSTNDGAQAFGMPKGTPVVLAGNDQTAGAYAAKLEKNRGLLVTLGTAQAAYVYTSPMPRAKPLLIRGPYPGRGFYRMATDGFGGNVVNWAKTVIAGCETDEKFFAQAARSPPGCQGLVFDLGCGNGLATWRNVGMHHTSADFARSVLESLTRRTSEMIRQLVGRVNRHHVLVAGGGSENLLWVRMLSETLGVSLKVTEGRPCIGAARMALQTVPRIRQ